MWYYHVPLCIAAGVLAAMVLFLVPTAILSFVEWCVLRGKCPDCGAKLTFENEAELKRLRSKLPRWPLLKPEKQDGSGPQGRDPGPDVQS